jgi:hypothetical protein
MDDFGVGLKLGKCCFCSPPRCASKGMNVPFLYVSDAGSKAISPRGVKKCEALAAKRLLLKDQVYLEVSSALSFGEERV